jgi:hypothetical protein
LVSIDPAKNFLIRKISHRLSNLFPRSPTTFFFTFFLPSPTFYIPDGLGNPSSNSSPTAHLPYLRTAPTIKMGKTKEPKTGSKSKSEVKPLKAVKNSAVTKPSQTPIAKSKQIAQATAAKINGKPKPTKKAATPSDSDSSEDSSAESESGSESEVETTKPTVNGKINGKTNGVAKPEVDSSDSSSESSDSSESEDESDSDEEMNDADSKKPAAESESDSEASESEEESDEESDEEAAPVAAAKDVKKAVNGTAKAVAKPAVSKLSNLATPFTDYLMNRRNLMMRKTLTMRKTPLLAMMRTLRLRTMTATRTVVQTVTPARKMLRSHPRSVRLKKSLLLLLRRPRSVRIVASRTCSLAI